MEFVSHAFNALNFFNDMFRHTTVSYRPLLHRPFNLLRPARKAHYEPFASTRKHQLVEPEPNLPRKRTTLSVVKRAFKYTAFGVLAIGASSISAYWAFQCYSEYVGMKPESDPETIQWQWHLIENEWSNDPAYRGTDPALSSNTRRLIRAAWQAYTYGTGKEIVAIQTTPSSDLEPEVYGVDARLQTSEVLLRKAIQSAEADSSKKALLPNTMPILILRHASVLEQLGEHYLLVARQEYENAWHFYSDYEPYNAYISLKLGDINHRLGQDNSAIRWWNQSLQLLEPKNTIPTKSINFMTVPRSPLKQRLFFANMVSQSAYLAASGKLREAELIEESSLEILRSLIQPQSINSVSPPHSLHTLYLLQRSSILSIHLAETLFAKRRPVSSSIEWLANAAQSSEKVVASLTGATSSDIISLNNIPKRQLVNTYTTSFSMVRPAHTLLRDAQRSAAEAWNLLGLLYESQKKADPGKVLECFQRAVYWASIAEFDGSSIRVNDAVLEADWQAYWDNFQRASKSGVATNR